MIKASQFTLAVYMKADLQICQLSFLHNTALEAISQQKRHVSAFFNIAPGSYPSQQLATIEQILWKSKQVRFLNAKNTELIKFSVEFFGSNKDSL